MATTTITITPPAGFAQELRHSQQEQSTAQPKVVFEPVNDTIITQIIGYVSLGLAELGTDPNSSPALLYKWHIWLLRMNSWMKRNRKVYPRFMNLPAVKVPATLYYLETIKEQSAKIANATLAPLGPLSPIDMNTLTNALRKGMEGCNDAEKEHNLTELAGFVKDVNKLATFAIEPHRQETSSLSPVSLVLPQRDVAQLANTNTAVTTDVVYPLPPLGRIVESFTGSGGSRRNVFSNVPIWCWVAALMIIMYIFVSPAKEESYGQQDSFMRGGSAQEFNKIISISDFNIPRL